MNSTVAAYLEEISELEQELQSADAAVEAAIARRDDIKAKISELRGGLAVVRRLVDRPEVQAPGLEIFERRLKKRPPDPASKKPANTPSTRAMILLALKSDAAANDVGMAPIEIARYLAERWWPGCKAENINTTAWRMADRHEILREHGKYRLPPQPPLRD